MQRVKSVYFYNLQCVNEIQKYAKVKLFYSRDEKANPLKTGIFEGRYSNDGSIGQPVNFLEFEWMNAIVP